jgi:hypothetical protein
MLFSLDILFLLISREETADRLNITANIESAFHSVDAEKMKDFVVSLREKLFEIGVNLNDIPIIGI